MTKRNQKNNKNKGKQQQQTKKTAPEVDPDDSYIQLGGFKLTNLDFEDIIRKSKEVLPNQDKNSDATPLTEDTNFMQKLDAYATRASKEIVDSSVHNLPSTSGPAPPAPPKMGRKNNKAKAAAPKPAAPQASTPAPQARVQQVIRPLAPRVHFARELTPYEIEKAQLAHQLRRSPQSTPLARTKKSYRAWLSGVSGYVNPRGQDLPYICCPTETEPLKVEEMIRRQWKEGRKDLLTDPLIMESQEVIARAILDQKFKLAFKFNLEIHFAHTGCSRNQTFVYAGKSTHEVLKSWFRKCFTLNNSFQWFYMDHDHRFMEVYNDHTLKQMLVTHGAYPKGYYSTDPMRTAKVYCVPTTENAVRQIAFFMMDGVMGMDCEDLNLNNTDAFLTLPNCLTPDVRERRVFRDVIVYSDVDLDHAYNRFTSVSQLTIYCQRPMLACDLFAEPRSGELSMDEIRLAILERYENPYFEKTRNESVQLEELWILDQFRKSNKQDKNGIVYVEEEMRKLVHEIVMEKNREGIKNAYLHKDAILQKIVHMENEQPNTVPPPTLLRDHRCCAGDGFKECTVQHRPNPSAFKEVTVQRRPNPAAEANKFVNEIRYFEEPRELARQHMEADAAEERAKRASSQQLEQVRVENQQKRTEFMQTTSQVNDDEAKEMIANMKAQIEVKNEVQKTYMGPERLAKDRNEFSIDELLSDAKEELKKVMIAQPPSQYAPSDDDEDHFNTTLPRCDSQENVTITQDCVDEVKISKTIIKVGMDKPKPKTTPGFNRLPSQYDEFKTPLGSVSTFPGEAQEDQPPELPSEGPPEEDETFEDCESTPTGSPAISEHKSTEEVLAQTSSLLSQAATSRPRPFITTFTSGPMTPLQRLAKEKADEVTRFAERLIEEDPSLSRVQTMEEAMAEEEKLRESAPTTPKKDKAKTS